MTAFRNELAYLIKNKIITSKNFLKWKENVCKLRNEMTKYNFIGISLKIWLEIKFIYRFRNNSYSKTNNQIYDIEKRFFRISRLKQMHFKAIYVITTPSNNKSFYNIP